MPQPKSSLVNHLNNDRLLNALLSFRRVSNFIESSFESSFELLDFIFDDILRSAVEVSAGIIINMRCR